jgi:hypothetical protein
MLFSWLSVCCSIDVFSTTKVGKAERRLSPQLSFPCPTSSLSRRHFLARHLIQTQTVKRHTRPSIYYRAQLCKGKLKPEVHQHLSALQPPTFPPPTRPVCTESRKKKNSTTRHALRVRLVLCRFQCVVKALMGHYPLFSGMKAIHFSRTDPKPLVLGEPYSLTRAKRQLKVQLDTITASTRDLIHHLKNLYIRYMGTYIVSIEHIFSFAKNYVLSLVSI